MARGPLPKDESKKERRNAPTFETTQLDGSPAKAPTMPRGDWHRLTRVWWKTWKASPQAQHFLATDWLRLVELLPTVDAYFNGDLVRLNEIRQNESLLGATPMDRLRLRWRLREADKEAEREERAAAAKKPSRRRADPRLKVVEGGAS